MTVTNAPASAARSFTLTAAERTVPATDYNPGPDPRGVVLLVHGYGEHSGRYRNLALRLSADNIAFLAVDLPGHGMCDEARGELPAFDELHAIINTARAWANEHYPDAPFYLLGHSLGGLIAAGYVAEHGAGIAGVILSSPVLGEWPAVDAFLALEQIPPSLVRARHLSRSEAFATEYAQDALIWRGPLSRDTLLNAQAQLDALAEGGASVLAGQRVLWLHGTADRIVSSATTMRGLAALGVTDLTARLYPLALHEVFNDLCHDDAYAHLRDFISAGQPPRDNNNPRERFTE